MTGANNVIPFLNKSVQESFLNTSGARLFFKGEGLSDSVSGQKNA